MPVNLVGVTVTSVWIGLPVAYLLLWCYTRTYDPLFLFPAVRRDFCFLWLAIAANAREEKVRKSDRPKKAGKREKQNQSEERRKHLWWWSIVK